MNNENIAKDLLYLYEENLLSEDSKKFVEENLNKSEKLKNDLKNIRNDKFTEDNTETKPLKFIEKNIKKDRKNFAAIIASISVSILVLLLSFLTRPIYFENDGNLFEITDTNDKIFVTFNENISNIEKYTSLEEDSTTEIVFLKASTNNFYKIFKNDLKKTIELDKKDYRDIYYENHNKKASKIYGSGKLNIMILPRLAINMYFYLILILTLILILISLFFKKDIIKYLILIPISFFLAMLSRNGFEFYTYNIKVDFIYIIIFFFAYYFLFVSLLKLFLVHRKNKLNF